jgi:hypothetical protein
LSTADGRTVSLEQLRGRIVYLDFGRRGAGLAAGRFVDERDRETLLG